MYTNTLRGTLSKSQNIIEYCDWWRQHNGAGPLLESASVNAPQMGDKHRRPILSTKRDTTEKEEEPIVAFRKSILPQEDSTDTGKKFWEKYRSDFGQCVIIIL